MRYRLLKCSSSPCEEASGEACSWRGKTLAYLKTGVQSIFDFGEQTSSVSSLKKKRLTPVQKDFCREMATHHLRPLRIRNALARKFDTPLEAVPSLSTVQNVVNYYSRKYLDNHDRLDTIKAWVHSHAFNGSETLHQPFTFG
ncbi:hypothetical protein P3T76_005634 [Phytophthora citrophthora]|uniref:Uncharacterized protein n=1 Tax=Phytophthora citrophthora TaxID=4793 RepID=A0AAD9LPS7_9STRA|nr:hypothetical protein P3T76_005634 [Phytophthora citrophthora]